MHGRFIPMKIVPLYDTGSNVKRNLQRKSAKARGHSRSNSKHTHRKFRHQKDEDTYRTCKSFKLISAGKDLSLRQHANAMHCDFVLDDYRCKSVIVFLLLVKI